MAAVVFTHPVDQTKVRSQLQRSQISMLQMARKTVNTSSVLGLWEGLTGSLLRQATYGAARFGIYAELKERDIRKKRKGSLVLNGAIAGVVSGIVGAPAGGPSLIFGGGCRSWPNRACHGADVCRWNVTTNPTIRVQERHSRSIQYMEAGRSRPLLPRLSVDYCA